MGNEAKNKGDKIRRIGITRQRMRVIRMVG